MSDAHAKGDANAAVEVADCEGDAIAGVEVADVEAVDIEVADIEGDAVAVVEDLSDEGVGAADPINESAEARAAVGVSVAAGKAARGWTRNVGRVR